MGAGQRVVDQVVQRDPGEGEGERAGLDAGEFEQVVDHAGEAFDLGADSGEVALGLFGDAVLQGFGHRAQAGQRGAQVVRDPGDEFPPGGVQGPFAVPGFGQPGAGGGEFGADGGQFPAQRPVRRGEPGVAADGAGGHRQGPAARGDLAAQQRGGEQRDHRGHRQDGADHAEVVVGEEHRLGDRERPGGDGEDADHGDGEQGERQRAAAQQAQRGQAEQSGGGGAERGEQGDQQQVLHAAPPRTEPVGPVGSVGSAEPVGPVGSAGS